MTGLQSEIRARILGATAHVSIFRGHGDSFEDYPRVVAVVRGLPGVLGAAPALYGKALLTSTAGSAVVTLKGIVPDEEGTVTDVVAHIREGGVEAFAPDGVPAPVLLGTALADSLNVGLGDVVTVTSPKGRLSPVGMLPRVARLRVVGLVKTGLFEFDSAWGYVPLGTAQRLFEQGNRTTLVEVRLEDMFGVKGASQAILERLGEGYLSTDWIEMNRSLFSALWLEKVAIGITIGLIVMVAALNIVATLILMVMEKHKDIAILVSMGAPEGAIRRIFVLQGTIIGVVGTAAGSLLGWGACRLLDRYRVVRIPEDVYQIAWVPFRLLPADAVTVAVGALLVCFLATLHPAASAARVDPAEALRYE